MRISTVAGAGALAFNSICALPLLSAPAAATDVSAIELRRLFAPSQADLKAESRGGIYIYEGLRDIDVERALDEEFERIQHMMFIRTLKTEESGELARDPDTGAVVTEDDGC